MNSPGCLFRLHPRWTLVPEALSPERETAGRSPAGPAAIAGLKEDVYAPDFRPSGRLAEELGLRPNAIIVTVRPPADEAHYHNPESDILLR